MSSSTSEIFKVERTDLDNNLQPTGTKQRVSTCRRRYIKERGATGSPKYLGPVQLSVFYQQDLREAINDVGQRPGDSAVFCFIGENNKCRLIREKEVPRIDASCSVLQCRMNSPHCHMSDPGGPRLGSNPSYIHINQFCKPISS